MKELNQFRLLAGIPIDGKIEVTEKTPVTESVQLDEAVSASTKGPILNDFWVVQKVSNPDTPLSAVIQRTNTKGLCHLIQQGGRDFEEDLMLFNGWAKPQATKEAKKRIRAAQKQKVEAEEEALYKEEEEEFDLRAERDEEDARDIEMEMRQARRDSGEILDDDDMFESVEMAECTGCNGTGKVPDRDSDPKSKTGLKRVECPVCKGAKKISKKVADQRKSTVKQTKALIDEGYKVDDYVEYQPKQGKSKNVRITKVLGDGKYHATGGLEITDNDIKGKNLTKANEGITTVVAPDSWEDDEDDAVNVVTGNGKKTAPFKDIEVVKADPKSTDSDRKNDKDESPQQLHALDTKSPQDQSDGNDLEAKCPCPAKIKGLLKTEADEARAKAKKLSITDREDSYFYDDLARAFDDLYNHLDGGTVYDVKKAQIFMTSLMSPMMNKIPADVVNWIAKGGQQRSLKSYMQAVPDKYPITGPRNAL